MQSNGLSVSRCLVYAPRRKRLNQRAARSAAPAMAEERGEESSMEALCEKRKLLAICTICAIYSVRAKICSICAI